MVYIFQLLFIFTLVFLRKGNNNCYKILVLLQLTSFVVAPLVANTVRFATIKTFLNTIFCLLNLYFIIASWRRVKFETVEINNLSFFLFYKKVLYIILKYTIVVDLIVIILVRIFMPDIAELKAKSGYRDLYETIPYFGFLFRYVAVSKYLGLLALPICVYYMERGLLKEAFIALLMSTSSLFAALSSYSRAEIFNYIMLVVCLYFYTKHIFNKKINYIIKKYLKKIVLAITVVFVLMTISRFSSPIMSHYGKRIPQASYVKDPIVYSFADYVSQGFPRGIDQLEVHEDKDVLNGEPLCYDLFIMLSYFHIISWNAKDYAKRLHSAYNKEGIGEWNSYSVFHGYTCRMVKIMGYTLTLLFDIFYYLYVRRKSLRKKISITSLTILIFMLTISISSIFYSAYAPILYPFLFYLFMSIFYHLTHYKS